MSSGSKSDATQYIRQYGEPPNRFIGLLREFLGLGPLPDDATIRSYRNGRQREAMFRTGRWGDD